MGVNETEKGQEGAKMVRKGAAKMGPHQAGWGLKAALAGNGQNKAELNMLDELVQESKRS